MICSFTWSFRKSIFWNKQFNLFSHSLTFEMDYNPKVAKTLKLIYNHYLMQESAICFDCGPLNKVLGHSDHTFNKTKILKLQLNIVVKKLISGPV